MKKQVLLFMMIVITMVAHAADVVIDGIFYNLSQKDKTAEVTSSPNKYTGAIVIPNSFSYGGTEYSVNKIGGWAFRYCKSLTSVVIPESVTYIGNRAFEGCDVLSSISISNGVTSIDEKAFYGCSSLTSLTIPNSVMYIGSFAFMDCDGLTSISIGNNVTDIGTDAFRDCDGLTSVTIPNSVTIIRERAFLWCSNLKSITIGSGVNHIADAAFSQCSKLEEIYCFAKKVPVTPYGTNTNMFKGTPIGNATLYAPASLINQYKAKDPWYGFGTIAPLDYIDGIYYIFEEDEAEVTYLDEGYNSYSGDVVIPASVTTVWGETYTVTSIGECAFKSCNNLSTVVIPSSVKSISTQAFCGCRKLPSITIPNNVTTIGSEAFGGCTKLTDVYCQAAEVPRTESNAFDNSSILSATLHIPNRSIHFYKASTPWSFFGNYAGLHGNAYTLSYLIDGTEYKSYKVWEDEKIIPEEGPIKEGHTFSGWSDIPEWMPANDVMVTGSYSINSYTLTYTVDDEVYKRYEVLYDTSITAEDEPAKEGYTFGGWSEIPEKMPAHDVLVAGSFSINSYKLIYMVDGEEYKSYQINYGTKITAEVAPTLVGYTFSGWSEVPETMPAHDVTVTGSFSINLYTLTYMVDDELYKTYEVEYGTAINPEEEPIKTGYTFSGWSKIPSTMPAKDVTISGSFSINKYKLIYVIDGKEYKTVEAEFNSVITPEADPTKEGHTFSGWSEIPETMPANDVTVTGSFTVNTYTLTYMIDGEVYKTSQVDYGTTIIPEALPTKTGYTFSGWDDVPLTMPAMDVTVSGTFAINSYILTYLVDGEVYKTFEVVYETAITPEVEPIKEGYTFSGWSEIPETMPANNVTVTGSFVVNKYKVTYIIDGKVFATEYVEYGATIVPPYVDEKEGFIFSGFVDVPETMPAHDISIYGSFTSGIEEIISDTQHNVRIYTLNGKKIGKLKNGLNIVVLTDGTVKKIMVK